MKNISWLIEFKHPWKNDKESIKNKTNKKKEVSNYDNKRKDTQQN